MSSKRRRNLWDDEAMKFKVGDHDAQDEWVDLMESDEDAGEGVELLDEAHQALSKLYTKSHKRTKQMRGVRRQDAWQ